MLARALGEQQFSRTCPQSHLVHTMKQHGRSHEVVCTLRGPQTLLTWYVHSHLSGKSLLLLINKPPLATLTGITSAAMQINTSCKARTQLLKGTGWFPAKWRSVTQKALLCHAPVHSYPHRCINKRTWHVPSERKKQRNSTTTDFTCTMHSASKTN